MANLIKPLARSVLVSLGLTAEASVTDALFKRKFLHWGVLWT